MVTRREEEEAHEKEHVSGDAKGVSRGPGLRPNKPGLPEPHRRIGPKKLRTHSTEAEGMQHVSPLRAKHCK